MYKTNYIKTNSYIIYMKAFLYEKHRFLESDA